MKLWTSLFLILILFSCKDFDLKKQSADEILQEELNSINWSEVDFYPTFENCGEMTSKEESKICFETEVKNAVSQRLRQQKIITSNTAEDTLLIELYISANGETRIKTTQISDDISSQNPELGTWLREAIAQLPEVYPAQKRSVPVPLRTELPIVLK